MPLALDEAPLLSVSGTAATSIGNVGPGLEALGRAEHFGWLSQQANVIVIKAMAIGWLEPMTMLMAIVPRTWRS